MLEGKIVPLNVVLLPDNATRDKAISHEMWIKRFPLHFNLDENHKPHLTLVQGKYPQEALANLFVELEEVAKTTKPFEVEMEQCTVTQTQFVYWNAKNSTPLIELRERVKEVALKHGEVLSLDPYIPHITISRLKDITYKDDVLKALSEPLRASFTVTSLDVLDLETEMGTVSTSQANIPFGL